LDCFRLYDCSFALFQVETVNTISMNVLNHRNSATMVYASIVWVCIIERNIKTDPREIGWGRVDSIYLAQDRDQLWVLVNMVTNLQVS
jgi:hypothetical protein